jgi:tetratricopeptide (TPR) repeat protein
LRRSGWIALLLVAASFAVYAPVRHHEFVAYDDDRYIVDNPNLREPLGLDSVRRAFASPYETNWIPLTWISLHIDHALYGLAPAGYHLTNVALHALSAVLLFVALVRMTRATGPSAFAAAVFALHPLHVESVAWAAERKDTLSGLFWMCTLLAYGEYARRRFSPGRYALVLLFLVLSLLAKPMGVTLPFVLLLLDYWPLSRLGASDGRARPDPRRLRRAIVEKLPMLLVVVAVAAVTYFVQLEAGAMSREPMLPFRFRLMNAVDAYATYLARSFWPANLAVFYPHPLRTLSGLRTGALALGLAAVTAAAVRTAAARPYLIVGWLWYLGTLVPVIGLVQVGMQSRADRYMYLPLVGLSIAVAWGAADVFAARRRGRRLLAVAAGLALVALAVASARQVSHWRDTTSLFARAIAVTEGNFLAHQSLANAHLAAGRLEQAKRHYAEALRLKPRWLDPRIGLGQVALREGDVEAAIEYYRSVLRAQPDHPRALEQLGAAWLEAGDPARAERVLRRALRVERRAGRAEDAGTASVHALLAQALAARGERERSLEQYRRAVALRPDFAEAHANLGFALLQVGRNADARRHLERAIALGLEQAEVHAALGSLALRRREPEPAVRHFRETLRLDPEHVSAANNLAWLLATSASDRLRDPAESVRIAEATVRATGGTDPALLDTLAAAEASAGRFESAFRTATDAADRARAAGDDALADAIGRRAALYRSGRAYREASPQPDP